MQSMYDPCPLAYLRTPTRTYTNFIALHYRIINCTHILPFFYAFTKKKRPCCMLAELACSVIAVYRRTYRSVVVE